MTHPAFVQDSCLVGFSRAEVVGFCVATKDLGPGHQWDLSRHLEEEQEQARAWRESPTDALAAMAVVDQGAGFRAREEEARAERRRRNQAQRWDKIMAELAIKEAEQEACAEEAERERRKREREAEQKAYYADLSRQAQEKAWAEEDARIKAEQRERDIEEEQKIFMEEQRRRKAEEKAERKRRREERREENRCKNERERSRWAVPPRPKVSPFIKSPWSVLGVTVGSGPSEIKRAYYAAAMVHHPDHGGDPAKWLEIDQAYRSLT